MYLVPGLIPILSVCDQASTNASTVNTLINPNNPTSEQSGRLLKYTVDGHQLIHVYDPSHLIKSIRNNLQTKNLAHFISERWTAGYVGYDDDTASLQIATWDDINALYRLDLCSTQRRLHKLTDEHLQPNKRKMRVAEATQIFSSTCGNLMLSYAEQGIVPADFDSTAQLVLFMNDAFDSINGSVKGPNGSLKSAVSAGSLHFEFWDYAVTMLSNMFYVDKDTGERNNRSSVLKKFESTIRGYIEICQTCFRLNIPKVNIRYLTSFSVYLKVNLGISFIQNSRSYTFFCPVVVY